MVLQVVSAFRHTKGPMMRTAAKKRWLEDARGGEMVTMETWFGQSAKPHKGDGDPKWGPGSANVMSMVRFGLGWRRATVQPDGVWSRSVDRNTKPTTGDDDCGLELTWSSWRRIRITRIEGDLKNINNIIFEIRKRIYLNSDCICLSPPNNHVEQLKQEAMAEPNICQDQIVEFSTEDVAVSMPRAKMSLLGRLFIENRPSLSVMHKIVTNAWECRGGDGVPDEASAADHLAECWCPRKASDSGWGQSEMGLKVRGDGGKGGGKGNSKREEGLVAGRSSEREQEQGSGERGKPLMEGRPEVGLKVAASQGAKKSTTSPKMEGDDARVVDVQATEEGTKNLICDQVAVEPGKMDKGENSEMLDAATIVTDERCLMRGSLCGSFPCSGGCGSLAIGWCSRDASTKGWS
ncbi:unnamed protein product [Linum trigynum]|uniref:DUF4283 domain-containing protein n=1 Tax=Linum trigynum TaxID=586398 RepID=A0AAV2FCD6_9ROSI